MRQGAKTQLQIQWVKRSKRTFRELTDDRLRNESSSSTNVEGGGGCGGGGGDDNNNNP